MFSIVLVLLMRFEPGTFPRNGFGRWWNEFLFGCIFLVGFSAIFVCIMVQPSSAIDVYTFKICMTEDFQIPSVLDKSSGF